MDYCKNCKRWTCGAQGTSHEMSIRCGNFIPPPNADRIRSMSDEEMADYFRNHASMCPDLEENETVCKGANFTANDEMCQKCWLDWLKSEAEEGEE